MKQKIKNISTKCQCGHLIEFYVLDSNYLEENFNVTVCANCHSLKTNVKKITDDKKKISSFMNKFSYNINEVLNKK